MIKYETINGTLFCRMVEPTPLTPEATFPCVVRLIQDDSPMGLCNRWKYSEKQDFLKKDWTISSLENNLNKVKDIHYSQFEIIGYPVVEGSAEWALYQMMQGKKVSYKSAIGNVYWALNQDGNVQYYDMDDLAYIGTIRSKLEFAENYEVKTGWQLYEPDHDFNVGDWVEYRLDSRIYYGEINDIRDHAYYLSFTTEDIPPDQARAIRLEKITRKLKPSEVVIHIGCLSGTVKPSIYDDGAILTDEFVLFQDRVKYAIIPFTMLDAPTRNLVGQLLKAQEEK